MSRPRQHQITSHRVRQEMRKRRTRKTRRRKRTKKDKKKGRFEFCEPHKFVAQLQRFRNISSSNVNYSEPAWTREDFQKCFFNMTRFENILKNKTRMNHVASKLVKLGLEKYVITNVISSEQNQTLDVNIDQIIYSLPFIFVIDVLTRERILPPEPIYHGAKGGKEGGKDCDDNKNKKNEERSRGGGKKNKDKKNKNGENDDDCSSEEKSGGKKNKNFKLNKFVRGNNNDDRMQLLLMLGSPNEAFGDFGKRDNNNNDRRRGGNDKDDNNNGGNNNNNRRRGGNDNDDSNNGGGRNNNRRKPNGNRGDNQQNNASEDPFNISASGESE